MIEQLQVWAKRLKTNLVVLYLACRDSRTPWYAKGLAICVVAYAISPIDLIPDFIPILGYLDDLILVPAGIFLALKLIPPKIAEDCWSRAANMARIEGKFGWVAAVVIVLVWAVVVTWAGLAAYRALNPR